MEKGIFQSVWNEIANPLETEKVGHMDNSLNIFG